MDRRRFTACMVVGLLESLRSRDLLAASARDSLGPWFRELTELTRALRTGRVRDLEYQAQMELLFARVDLAALAGMIDLDAAAGRMSARSYLGTGVDLRGVPDLPERHGFGARLFVCRKGGAIVPHGHINMCTGFIVLRGRWRGRHYDRLESGSDHLVITPTIDRTFVPGDVSTISDHRDNVHWFTAETDTAFIFNVHVAGYDAKGAAPGRQYVDPGGEALAGGRIKAPRLTAAACLAKYG